MACACVAIGFECGAERGLMVKRDIPTTADELLLEKEAITIAAQREQIAARSGASRRSASTAALGPVSAPASAAALGPKLSRNAPCWCGSGKRYKRCHTPADGRLGP